MILILPYKDIFPYVEWELCSAADFIAIYLFKSAVLWRRALPLACQDIYILISFLEIPLVDKSWGFDVSLIYPVISWSDVLSSVFFEAVYPIKLVLPYIFVCSFDFPSNDSFIDYFIDFPFFFVRGSLLNREGRSRPIVFCGGFVFLQMGYVDNRVYVPGTG